MKEATFLFLNKHDWLYPLIRLNNQKTKNSQNNYDSGPSESIKTFHIVDSRKTFHIVDLRKRSYSLHYNGDSS